MLAAELTEKQFRKVSHLVYQHCGIHLKDGKQALVRARLLKRLRSIGIGSVDEYMAYIDSEKGCHELDHMIDVMTTNKTSFFRESEHFRYLTEVVLPNHDLDRLRIWSAACSSGEEPYSIAMQLNESIPAIQSKDVLILGTDISNRMLQIARNGVYPQDRLEGMSAAMIQRYFIKDKNTSPPAYRVKETLCRLVRLAQLNLMEPWPMNGPLDVIFCRNVMIYFDRPTRQRLINRFWDILTPGGYLFVGHSEGLSGITHKFHYEKPATYRK